MKFPDVRLVVGGTLIVVALAAGGATACGLDKATEPGRDAPRGETNDNPADTGTMPDGFNNWAAKCDGPNRVYTTFHGDAAYGGIAVVPNDPRCTGRSVSTP